MIGPLGDDHRRFGHAVPIVELRTEGALDVGAFKTRQRFRSGEHPAHKIELLAQRQSVLGQDVDRGDIAPKVLRAELEQSLEVALRVGRLEMVGRHVEGVLPPVVDPERALGRVGHVAADGGKGGAKPVARLGPVPEHAGIVEGHVPLVEPHRHGLAGGAAGLRQDAAPGKAPIQHLLGMGAHVAFGEHRHARQIGDRPEIPLRVEAGLAKTLAVKRDSLVRQQQRPL